MRKFAAALAALTVLAAGVRLAAEEPPAPRDKDAAAKLLGDYTIVAGEKFGQKDLESRFEGSSVLITEKTITVADKDKKETYVSTYRLDTGKRPWAITMTSTLAPKQGEVARGLIKKDGDTVTLIYALPGGEVPTEFKTKEKQLLFVLKELKKAKRDKTDGQ